MTRRRRKRTRAVAYRVECELCGDREEPHNCHAVNDTRLCRRCFALLDRPEQQPGQIPMIGSDQASHDSLNMR